MNLQELKAQRDVLDREIKEREERLEQLSIDNLRSDLGNVSRSDHLSKVAQMAAERGLALTTTKDLGVEIVHVVQAGGTTTFLSPKEGQDFVKGMHVGDYMLCTSHVPDARLLKKWSGVK